MFNGQIRQALSRIHRSIRRDCIGRAGRDTGRTTPTTILVARLEFWRCQVSQQHCKRAQGPVRLRDDLARASTPTQSGTDRERTLEDRTVIDIGFCPNAQTCRVLLELCQMWLQLRMIVRAPSVPGDPSDSSAIFGNFWFRVRVRNHQCKDALRRRKARGRITPSSHARWQVIHARVKSSLEPTFEHGDVSGFDLRTGPARRIESDLERKVLQFVSCAFGIHCPIVPRSRSDSLRCAGISGKRATGTNHNHARASVQFTARVVDRSCWIRQNAQCRQPCPRVCQTWRACDRADLAEPTRPISRASCRQWPKPRG